MGTEIRSYGESLSGCRRRYVSFICFRRSEICCGYCGVKSIREIAIHQRGVITHSFMIYSRCLHSLKLEFSDLSFFFHGVTEMIVHVPECDDLYKKALYEFLKVWKSDRRQCMQCLMEEPIFSSKYL